MTKQFNLLQLFTIVDGRLLTSIDDVYEMLNHICDTSLYTHHLLVAMNYLTLKNPIWLNTVKDLYNSLGCNKDMDFKECINILSQNNKILDIPQLKDEFDTSDFGKFMIDNSLLLKK